MTEPTYLEKLNAHILIELQRYFPDVTNIRIDFDGDGEMQVFIDEDNTHPADLAQINAGDDGAEWFTFITNTGRYLTLPLYIEE